MVAVQEHHHEHSGAPDSVALADPTSYNVEEIADIERKSLGERTSSERVSDVMTKAVGSMTSVLLHLGLFAFWFVVNLNLIPGLRPFDPFPFGILTLIVSSEGVFLAIFILVSQNRMTRQADRRAHLDLQVSMLAEQELTMMLRLQQKLCDHLGVDTAEITATHRLLQRTDVRQLVDELEEKLPGNR